MAVVCELRDAKKMRSTDFDNLAHIVSLESFWWFQSDEALILINGSF